MVRRPPFSGGSWNGYAVSRRPTTGGACRGRRRISRGRRSVTTRVTGSNRRVASSGGGSGRRTGRRRSRRSRTRHRAAGASATPAAIIVVVEAIPRVVVAAVAVVGATRSAMLAHLFGSRGAPCVVALPEVCCVPRSPTRCTPAFSLPRAALLCCSRREGGPPRAHQVEFCLYARNIHPRHVTRPASLGLHSVCTQMSSLRPRRVCGRVPPPTVPGLWLTPQCDQLMFPVLKFHFQRRKSLRRRRLVGWVAFSLHSLIGSSDKGTGNRLACTSLTRPSLVDTVFSVVNFTLTVVNLTPLVFNS